VHDLADHAVESEENRMLTGTPYPAITLTSVERAAVLELGLRPTYSVDGSAAHRCDVETMLTNAALWKQAARIISAARTGVIPPELHPLFVTLLAEAIPETTGDLERMTRERDRWRAGDLDYSFPGFDDEAAEAMYEEGLERDRRVLGGLMSLNARLAEVETWAA
jgi:hypothetical protein